MDPESFPLISSALSSQSYPASNRGGAATLMFNNSRYQDPNAPLGSMASNFSERGPKRNAVLRQDANTTPQNASSGNVNAGLHNCVVRIRAEDQHLAADIVEGLELSKDKAMMSQLASQVNNMFVSSSRKGNPKRFKPSPLGCTSRRPIVV